MKIAAVVILYHPGSAVLQNITSYHAWVDNVFVYDNTEIATPGLREQLSSLSKVEYYSSGENEGVAKRLNQALQQAWAGQYDWLLTMDQDTRFPAGVIQQYFDCIQNFSQHGTVAMFGTRYSKQEQKGSTDCVFEEVENLITSGTLLNLQAAKKIGLFDEKLFIDSVDHDYVIRARALGFRVIRFSHIQLVHHLGNEVYRASIKTLYLKKKKKIVHSPTRCYYMYRNMLYLQKKHEAIHTVLATRLKKIVTGNLLANLFYGRNALATIKNLMKARRDFRSGNMGKMSDR